MRLPRPAPALAFGLAAAALAAPAAPGQTRADVVNALKPHEKTVELGQQTTGRVRSMMTAQIRILKTPDEKKNLEALDEFARFFAAKVTQQKYYNPGAESGEMKARPPEDSLDAVFNEIRGYLLQPRADNYTKMSVDNADYIKEFGAAFDRALAPFLKSPLPLIRVNAARMLAVVSSSGAAAHGKAITALIADPKTPPEVLLYAYQAAEAYLSTYDPYANGRTDAGRHSGEPADVIALVQALQKHIVFDKTAPFGPVADKAVVEPVKAVPPVDGATAPAEGAPAAPQTARLETRGLSPEQVMVVRYYRRHAVKALAKVRYDILGGKNNLPDVRPAFTLARVAVSDAAVSPPPSAAEAAEAVIGLCGMNLSPTINVDVYADAIAAGLATFALPKVQPDNRSIPWKLYAARLAAAFTDLRASVNRNPKANAAKPLLFSLADMANAAVVGRLDKPDGDRTGPDVERVRAWMQQNPPKDPARDLFADSPAYRLSPRPL